MEAQAVGVAFQFEIGPDENGLSGAAGIPLEALRGPLGGYLRVANSRGPSVCSLESSSGCTYPEGPAWQYVVSVTARSHWGGAWSGQLSAGFGLVSWDGRDEMIEAEFRANRQLAGSLSLLLGTRYALIPGVERTDPVVSNRDIDFFNFLVGVQVGIGGS